MKNYIRALRLGRWPRSASIVIGAGAYWAIEMGFSIPGWKEIFKVFFAFLLTWAISTSNYIINEISDAPFDKYHPDKSNRPVASGKVKLWVLGLLFILLSTISLYAAFVYFNRIFFYSLLSLLAAGFLYNIRPIRLKDKPYIDSISESINNPIRFTLGWATLSSAFPNVFILLSWWSFGNFLMVGKRLSELIYMGGERAGRYRFSMKYYTKKSLKIAILISGFLFLFFFLMFCVQEKLPMTALSSVFAIPFMVNFYKKASKESVEEPENTLVKGSIFLSLIIFSLVLLVGVLLDRVIKPL